MMITQHMSCSLIYTRKSKKKHHHYYEKFTIKMLTSCTVYDFKPQKHHLISCFHFKGTQLQRVMVCIDIFPLDQLKKERSIVINIITSIMRSLKRLTRRNKVLSNGNLRENICWWIWEKRIIPMLEDAKPNIVFLVNYHLAIHRWYINVNLFKIPCV